MDTLLCNKVFTDFMRRPHVQRSYSSISKYVFCGIAVYTSAPVSAALVDDARLLFRLNYCSNFW